MQGAALPRPERALVFASAQGTPRSPAEAKQMRTRSGPCDGAARHDVLVADDIDAPSEAGADLEAWLAQRKAKKKGGGKKRED